MAGCTGCTGCNDATPTVQLGEKLGGSADYVVALAGNPNTGKSTVFNYLTGLRQHTGNWAGKTVARAEGTLFHAGKKFKLVDLPGTYSLLAGGVDEEIARDFVLFGRPDCTVVVCDATVLERNLHLVLQILQITNRVVVCANLIDEANRKRIALEARVLERELGVPVVPTAARRGQGLDHLVEHVYEVAGGQGRQEGAHTQFDLEVEQAIESLAGRLRHELPGLRCARWIAIRLLDGDERVRAAVENGELAKLVIDGQAGELRATA